ncbi:MAG: hypothetical protein J7513_12125 [Solirubrobacteraceae bacterium]|nr:hypothetical protein [Solirubrobacteraceae bacterium]
MRRPSTTAATRCVTALLLATGVSGTALAADTGEAMGPPAPGGTEPAATTPTATAKPAAADLDTTPDPWRLGDDIAARVDARWNAARGVYMNEKGYPDTRLNALMLQLHGMAAQAGHVGASRNDARIAPMVQVLTSPPVLVARNLRPRQTGHFPHAPAWTPSIGEDPEQAVLHPSIDTAVVRALTAAWRARSVIGMTPELGTRIGQVLIDLAASPFYRAPSRALNQINWHAEVYAAALEVAGDKSVLDDYRAQLKWFADHAHSPAYSGGSPNLTSGGGFRYLPNRPRSAQLNSIETTEYGNLAVGALGFYQAFLKAGMQRLSAADEKVLRQWSKHMLLGSWTQAGYPNWDTGLGTKRRHLRQYWAWSLDGLMTASGPDALLGYPKQRQYARSIAEHGIALYLATAWSPDMAALTGPLPAKTSFNAPNGFTSGSGNELIGPLRFALLDASLDGRFQDVPSTEPPNWFAHDQETGRYALSTPTYNTAILPTRAGQGQGGVEPVRLFDGLMRPLTSLGGRGTGSFGLALIKDGVVRLDTEPALPGRQSMSDVRPSGDPPDTSRSFEQQADVTAGVRSGFGRVALRHRFHTTDLQTVYRLTRVTKGSTVALRVPLWGTRSSLVVKQGAIRQGGGFVRTGTPLTLGGRTTDGAEMTVRFGGIPRSAKVAFVTLRPDGYHPDGGRQAIVTFTAPSTRFAVTRRIDVTTAK